jgi:hypothetical protein
VTRIVRQTCTDHCSGCGRHFHGLGAFDAHLVRVPTPRNRWGTRGYELMHESGAEVGLQVWTYAGYCTMTGEEVEPVTVWQVIPSSQAAARWARLSQEARRSATASRSGPPAAPVAPDTLPSLQAP